MYSRKCITSQRSVLEPCQHNKRTHLDLLSGLLDPDDRDLEPLDVEPELRDALLRLELLLPGLLLLDGLRLGILLRPTGCAAG